jgi:hypothetical protein
VQQSNQYILHVCPVTYDRLQLLVQVGLIIRRQKLIDAYWSVSSIQFRMGKPDGADVQTLQICRHGSQQPGGILKQPVGIATHIRTLGFSGVDHRNLRNTNSCGDQKIIRH